MTFSAFFKMKKSAVEMTASTSWREKWNYLKMNLNEVSSNALATVLTEVENLYLKT